MESCHHLCISYRASNLLKIGNDYFYHMVSGVFGHGVNSHPQMLHPIYHYLKGPRLIHHSYRREQQERGCSLPELQGGPAASLTQPSCGPSRGKTEQAGEDNQQSGDHQTRGPGPQPTQGHRTAPKKKVILGPSLSLCSVPTQRRPEVRLLRAVKAY